MSILCFQGRFKYQPGQVRAYGMLAGGTGITPMFQVCILELDLLDSFVLVLVFSFFYCSDYCFDFYIFSPLDGSLRLPEPY